MTLIERLRQVCGDTTRYYVNPDGPEAADEIERLREALNDIANIVNPYEDGDTMQEIARAALKGDE